MKYFLGMAANYSRKARLLHTFAIGRKKDCDDLKTFLEKKYNGEAILCKNGRSALALALKAYFEPGDGILVNGFTCYAVYEAIKAARLKPIFVDISQENLNFNDKTLEAALAAACPSDTLQAAQAKSSRSVEHITTSAASATVDDLNSRDSSKTFVKGIIVQNTLGNPVDIKLIEKFAKKYDLTIIEDLAHCAGVKYPDGRECGTVGAATAFSFGKDKSIDTISGGAVVFRDAKKHEIKAPTKIPKLSDHLRARFYPAFGAFCRVLTYIHLGGALMRLFVKIHFVERSADNKLDLERRLSKFEAKLALRQFRNLDKAGEPPLREFFLVDNRDEVLKNLVDRGYYFSGFWYEKPVSPERYYDKVGFPEKECENAVFVSNHIINLPKHYSKAALEPARKIIEPFLLEEEE